MDPRTSQLIIIHDFLGGHPYLRNEDSLFTRSPWILNLMPGWSTALFSPTLQLNTRAQTGWCSVQWCISLPKMTSIRTLECYICLLFPSSWCSPALPKLNSWFNILDVHNRASHLRVGRGPRKRNLITLGIYYDTSLNPTRQAEKQDSNRNLVSPTSSSSTPLKSQQVLSWHRGGPQQILTLSSKKMTDFGKDSF